MRGCLMEIFKKICLSDFLRLSPSVSIGSWPSSLIGGEVTQEFAHPLRPRWPGLIGCFDEMIQAAISSIKKRKRTDMTLRSMQDSQKTKCMKTNHWTSWSKIPGLGVRSAITAAAFRFACSSAAMREETCTAAQMQSQKQTLGKTTMTRSPNDRPGSRPTEFCLYRNSFLPRRNVSCICLCIRKSLCIPQSHDESLLTCSNSPETITPQQYACA